ncbi:MAG: signal peptidase I [Candidatus Saccharimonadales bacterium]
MEYSSSTPHKNRVDSTFIKLAVSWVIAILIALGIQHFAFQPYRVFGASMEPTLHPGDYLIISKLSTSWSNLRSDNYVPDRGDIVVFQANGVRLIKRVIGLPGETITIANGQVTVSNTEHPTGFDPYTQLGISPVQTSGELSVQVPDNEVFVIGDNRTGRNSGDSRNQLGTVSTDDIIGSLVLRLWPADTAKAF